MKSLKQLYKIGVGPSSSHTMGPVNAVERFLSENDGHERYVVTLYGSLALTGKGHGTDVAVIKAFGSRSVTIVFDVETKCAHPNTMDLAGYDDGVEVCKMQVFSIGGGDILVAGETFVESENIYPHRTFEQIKDYCKHNSLRYWQYALRFEGDGVTDYIRNAWRIMNKCIDDGLEREGTLPGGLNVERRAKKLTQGCGNAESAQTRQDRIVSSYAFAVGEQNAFGGVVVTAPTCGASGVLPAVFGYASRQLNFSDEQIHRGL